MWVAEFHQNKAADPDVLGAVPPHSAACALQIPQPEEALALLSARSNCL